MKCPRCNKGKLTSEQGTIECPGCQAQWEYQLPPRAKTSKIEGRVKAEAAQPATRLRPAEVLRQQQRELGILIQRDMDMHQSIKDGHSVECAVRNAYQVVHLDAEDGCICGQAEAEEARIVRQRVADEQEYRAYDKGMEAGKLFSPQTEIIKGSKIDPNIFIALKIFQAEDNT